MSSTFKIPKKKQDGPDSAHNHSQSPLSRLQSPAPQAKGYGDYPTRGSVYRVRPGGERHPSADRSRFSASVRTLLGVNGADRGGASAAKARPPPTQRNAGSPDGWRPRRASDRLLRCHQSPDRPPPQRTRPPPSAGLSAPPRNIRVDSPDALVALRAQGHAGKMHAADRKSGANKPQKKNSSGSGPEDVCREDTPTRTGATPPSQRRSLGQPGLQEDLMEAQRDRWRRFREGRSSGGPYRSPKRPRPSDPIVLSSEEEEVEEQLSDGGRRTSLSGGHPSSPEKLQASPDPPAPSVLQLPFSSLHAGLMEADAGGLMTVTESCITLPITGAEEGEVTVVASQIRGYGVWDGGVACSGTLLRNREGPAPSLLFLWVSDSQAKLLQRDLLDILSPAAAGPACCVLLLVLQEQLQELQAAMLASILDVQQGGSSSSSSGPASPLVWADGLALVHSCPPPLDQHLLQLLGHSAQKSGRPGPGLGTSLSSAAQLPARLVQYPLAPGKGRITVTREDLACLDAGQFLNDVIVDFYLKYLLLEGVGGPVAERTHVFSSFFYKQLSRRRAAGEGDAPSAPDRHTRHRRVKTWTRHVDIFTKDFLFVPVNQEAHWFLVVVCFPSLEEVQLQDFQSPAGGAEGNLNLRLGPQKPPGCSQLGCQKQTVMKKPCVLVLDSLKLSSHQNVCRLLRDYLQVEWEVRRKTARVFTEDGVPSCSCSVPRQDNSSDCGLYLLQYAESFLQNPVVHFEFPLRLETWFPRQRVRQKREEIRSLILRLHETQPGH